METEAKVRALERLVLAGSTFEQVIEACQVLQQSDEHAQVYGVFFAGICVSYMRPFMSADRLGQLFKGYSTFLNEPEHARTHKDLEDGRNRAYAHNSPHQAAALLADESQRKNQTKLRLVVTPNGISCVPPELTWRKARLPAIVALCNFQIARIRDETEKLVRHLGGDRTYANGEYIIGETFP
jgi:hypothetical protein